MGLLDIFRKRPKPNLTPDKPFKEARSIDPELFGSLKDRALKGIRAGERDISDVLRDTPGFGFGKDFSTLANPAVQGALTNFREEIIPEISSQASSRGVGRSTIATNQIAREGRRTQNSIQQLLANFELLNRQQAKQDISNRTNLGERVFDAARQQANLISNASERLNQRTAQQQFNRDQLRRDDINSFVTGALTAGAGGIAGASGGGGLAGALTGVLNPNQGTQLNLANATDTQADQILQALRIKLGL